MNLIKNYLYNPYKRNKELQKQIRDSRMKFEELRSKVQKYISKSATEEQKKEFEHWFYMNYFIFPMPDKKFWQMIPKISSFNTVEEYMQMESYGHKEEKIDL